MRVSRRPDSQAATELARQLGALMRELDLAEIEVSLGTLKVRLQRPGAAPAAYPVPMAPAPTPAAGPVVDVATSATLVTVEAPMVGTFYRASSPTTEPYVRDGDVRRQRRADGQTEATRAMTGSEAEGAGRIERNAGEGGQPDQCGEALDRNEPAGYAPLRESRPGKGAAHIPRAARSPRGSSRC